MKSEYEARADLFAEKYGVKLEVLDKDYRPHFPGDKDERWCYKCRLSRKGKTYTFWFGQSLAAGDQKPTMYNILSCVEKYDPGTFENFCWEFGYDQDSKSAERIYKAVVKEYNAMERLFGDCMDELQKIN